MLAMECFLVVGRDEDAHERLAVLKITRQIALLGEHAVVEARHEECQTAYDRIGHYNEDKDLHEPVSTRSRHENLLRTSCHRD